MLLSDEHIQAAARTDIAAYCKARGIPLIPESGGTYRHANHQDLHIKGHDWERKNNGEGEGLDKGNAIQFVQEYEGLSFRDAVISLLAFTKSPLLKGKPSVRVMLESYANEAKTAVKPKRTPPPEKDINKLLAMQRAMAQEQPRPEDMVEVEDVPVVEYNRKSREHILPPPAPTNKNIVAYLNQIRGIDREIVADMIKRKLLYEDKRRNCVFIGYDQKHTVKHVSLEAAASQKQHAVTGDSPGNKKLFGWSATPDRSCPLLRVFIAPVDALSFMTIEKMAGNDWSHAHYLATDGMSARPIIHFLRMYKEIEVVEFCLDNSPAAHKFIREFTGQFADKSITWQPRLPNAESWNGQLRRIIGPAENKKGE